MSFEAYEAVWSIKATKELKFTGGLRLTLLAIAEFASAKNGYTCEAAIGTLAEMVGTKPRQIERNVRELEGMKLLTTQINRGRGNTNVYCIAHLIKPVTQDGKPVTEGIKPVTHDGFPIANDTPLTTGNLSPMTGFSEENLSSGAVKPVTHDTQTIYNQKNNIYIHPDDEPIAEIKTALSVVSKTPFWTETENNYDQAAHMIADNWHCTAVDVKAFGKWWVGNGHYKGKPVLKSLLQEFPNFLEARSPNSNGKHVESDPALEALLKQMEVTQ